MDERLLFERFHEALDVEVSPGGYERLRIALEKSSARPHRGSVLPMRFTKMSLKLVAAMAVAVIGIAAVAALLATHHVAEQPAPADPQVKAYERMMVSDDGNVSASASSSCTEVQDTACPASVNHLNGALQHWLDDLNRYQTPARFATVDSQSRRHINAAMSFFNALLAAQRAQDRYGMASALLAAADQVTWLDDIVNSITHSHQGSTATYMAAVRGSKPILDSCASCQQLISRIQPNCAAPYPSCLEAAAVAIMQVQNALAQTPAPTSLKQKDTRLQSDLAQADTAVIAMTTAMFANDQAAFDSARSAFRPALSAVLVDISTIVNP